MKDGRSGVAKSIARLDVQRLRGCRTAEVGIGDSQGIGRPVDGVGRVLALTRAIWARNTGTIVAGRPGVHQRDWTGVRTSVHRIATAEYDRQPSASAGIDYGALNFGKKRALLHQIRSDFGSLTPVFDFYPVIAGFGSNESLARSGKFQHPVPIPTICPVAGKEWGDRERS